MPTPKQVKEHYKRIKFHLYHLEQALNNAHDKEVVQYPPDKYSEESPCRMLAEVRNRIELTTQKARAAAFKTECMNEMKRVW